MWLFANWVDLNIAEAQAYDFILSKLGNDRVPVSSGQSRFSFLIVVLNPKYFNCPSNQIT